MEMVCLVFFVGAFAAVSLWAVSEHLKAGEWETITDHHEAMAALREAVR